MPRATFPSGRKLLVLLFLTLAIGGAWWWAAPPHDPIHRGRRLSEVVLGPDFWEGSGSTNRLSSRDYLIGLPPAGVRWLVYQVEYGRYPVAPGPRLFDHAPGWLRRRLPEKWGGLPPPNDVYGSIRARHALSLLGEAAAPAIPALLRGMHARDRDPRDLELTTRTLHGIGLASWSVVRDLLEHGETPDRLSLLETLPTRANRGGELSEADSDAEVKLMAETLIKLCTDPNVEVRNAAAFAVNLSQYYLSLKSPAPRFGQTVPTLVALLSDPEAKIREKAIIGIAWRNAEGAPAIPRLIELLDAPSVEERRTAAFALGKVDLEEQRSAPRLRMMLQDPEKKCVEEAAKALAEFARARPAESAAGKAAAN